MTHSNWNCPQCHNQNISGDLIRCPACGKKRNRWGYWDCRYCGTKQIRADHRECPNCGKAKERDVKFYLHDNCPVEFVDEVSGESAVRIGHQNWICPYCSQQNDDSVQVCTYCGAQRSESQERYHDIPSPAEQAKASAAAAAKRRRRKENKITCITCLIFSLIFILPVFFGIAAEALIYRFVKTVPLDSAYWESSIYVEALKTVQGSDWELPENARLIRTAIEDYEYIDHYEERTRSVWIDDYGNDGNDYGWDGGGGWDDGGWDDGGWDDGGWDDYGDGQFGMFRMPLLMVSPVLQPAAFSWDIEYYQEPVYSTRKETKYYYEYDTWVDERTVTKTGSGDSAPCYGDLTLKENERERERSILYYVTFTYKDMTEKKVCTEAEYYQFVRDGSVRFRLKDALTNPTKEFICETD